MSDSRASLPASNPADLGLDAARQALLDRIPLPSGAQIVERAVAYQHDGLDFEGVLVVDTALPGPRPAVVVAHDWFGISDTTRARLHMLARLGYAAFAADLYGAGIRPVGADGAQAQAGRFYGGELSFADRLGAGFATAAELDEVDAQRILTLGYCFGGTATLEFARTGAPSRGFVSFHGALIDRAGAGVDRIAGPVLVLTGAADPVVPDAALIAFEDELRQNPDLDWQVVSYSGAPHAFTVPGANYRELADHRSWRALEGLMDEVLA